MCASTLDPATAARFAKLALGCVHREYPNKIAHAMNSDADARPPRELTPAFYGCYDWHSSVHGHWMLARIARLVSNQPVAADARAALARSLTRQNLDREAAYLKETGRATFERPYGLAWLFQLAGTIRRLASGPPVSARSNRPPSSASKPGSSSYPTPSALASIRTPPSPSA